MLTKFKLELKSKPEYKRIYNGTTIIEAYGFGSKGSWYQHIQNWTGRYDQCLDDVDIALISYLQTKYVSDAFLGDWPGIGKYNNKDLNKNIHEGPLGFIMPYLYDEDYGMGIIDSGWDEVSDIHVYQIQDNGDKHEVIIPKIDQLFKTLPELISFIKQEMPKVRPPYIDKYYGVELQPWEIEEAREVLIEHGWDEQEIRYLRWIGRDRAFGACIEIRQWCVDIIEHKLNLTDEKTKAAWCYILDGLREANKKCTTLGFNGPNGMCGTYIYRATPEVNLEEFDESNLVKMSDGRVYILHEGD